MPRKGNNTGAWGGCVTINTSFIYSKNLSKIYYCFLFARYPVQDYTQKNNSSYVSIKEQRGDQSDTYLPS